ncbi:MAG: MepB family protein, partial [Burkholderiales bacterium]
ALYKYGIISKNAQGGKRAIRVYPPWDKPTNPQAKRTQAWQSQFFLEVFKDRVIDHNRTRLLYNIHK